MQILFSGDHFDNILVVQVSKTYAVSLFNLDGYDLTRLGNKMELQMRFMGRKPRQTNGKDIALKLELVLRETADKVTIFAAFLTQNGSKMYCI